jgi:hypothetical protein
VEITSEKVFKGKDSFAPGAIPPNFHPLKGGRNALPLPLDPGERAGFGRRDRWHWKKFWLLAFLMALPEISPVLFSPGRMNLLPSVHAGPPKGPQHSESDKDLPEPSGGLGSQEIPRSDGGKDRLYYSVTTPEEEKKAQQEEKEKEDKSWEMLRNIIIDRRTR